MIVGADGKPLGLLLAVLADEHGMVHSQCLAGVVSACESEAVTGCLPESATKALVGFAKSPSSAIVLVSGQIGFRASHVAALLATGGDLVSGVYAGGHRLELQANGWRRGKVAEVVTCLPGFMLVTKRCASRMLETHGPACFLPSVGQNGAEETGIAGFCRRWRELGGRALVDTSCRVDRFGTRVYTDDPDAAPNLPSGSGGEADAD